MFRLVKQCLWQKEVPTLRRSSKKKKKAKIGNLLGNLDAKPFFSNVYTEQDIYMPVVTINIFSFVQSLMILEEQQNQGLKQIMIAKCKPIFRFLNSNISLKVEICNLLKTQRAFILSRNNYHLMISVI